MTQHLTHTRQDNKVHDFLSALLTWELVELLLRVEYELKEPNCSNTNSATPKLQGSATSQV